MVVHPAPRPDGGVGGGEEEHGGGERRERDQRGSGGGGDGGGDAPAQKRRRRQGGVDHQHLAPLVAADQQVGQDHRAQWDGEGEEEGSPEVESREEGGGGDGGEVRRQVAFPGGHSYPDAQSDEADGEGEGDEWVAVPHGGRCSEGGSKRIA